MSDTFHLEGGFDLVASVKLTRPHEAGRAFAELTDRDQIDVLFGASEGFAEHENPSMQYAYMADELDRQPTQVQFEPGSVLVGSIEMPNEVAFEIGAGRPRSGGAA